MRYVKAAVGFAIGGLAIVAVVMAIQVYVGGYTYRNTPPLGNLIFGVVIFSPYVLCGTLGFAFGLRLSGVISRTAQSFLMGAGFIVAIGLLHWALNHFVRFNPFDSMEAYGALVFAMAIPSAFLPRALTRPGNEARAS